jgi:cephalosporin-C deacetylase-like acetyl esterase
MKAACFLVATFLVAMAARAAAPVLTVTADRAEALYRRGETVTFTIELTPPLAEAAVAWTISKDGVPPLRAGEAVLHEGRATVTGTLGEPGFLQCRATWRTPEKKELSALGGAGFDPLLIAPSLPMPDDFDAFWAAQKARLAAVPLRSQLTPVDSPQTGVEAFDLRVDALGAPVSGYFTRPIGAAAKSRPAILTLHSSGARSSNLAYCASWAKRGCLALDINAHGIANGQPESFYTGLMAGELKDYLLRGRESRETMYFLGMYLRIVRALDFLCAQPEWDGRTLVAYGSSQGGAQAFAAAGLDARVSFFAAGVPALCDLTGIVAGRVNGGPKFLADLAGSGVDPDEKVLQSVRYFDSMNFATRTQAAGIIAVGFVDRSCPPSSVYAAFNNLPNPRKIIFNDPRRGHGVSVEAGKAMYDAILAHLTSAAR